MAAGDISKALITSLRIMIEDEDSSDFDTDTTLYDFMKQAQLDVATLLHNDYLTEFEVIDTGVAVAEAGVDISTLGSSVGVLKGEGGIRDISVSGIFAEEIRDLRTLSMGSYFAGIDDLPKYYIRQNKIYVKIDTYTAITMDVYFLRIPPDPSASVDVLLNKGFHPLLLEVTASKAFRAREHDARADRHLSDALAKIKIANELIQG